MKPAHRTLFLMAVLAGLALTPLQAEDEGPALGVARVSLTNGDVTMRRGDSGDWIQAQVNLPLVEGDSIATGRASRAEVQLDYSNLVRLNESTQVNVAELGERRFRVQVERGIVTYSELRGGEADVDIETPLVAVRPLKQGLYRVEVLDERQVVVIVRKGEAEVASTEGTEKLKGGRAMVVRGGEGGAQFQLVKAEPKDDWDRWNERRDDDLRKSESYRYLSRGIYGGEDLDYHGRWAHVSGYGNCWFPSVGIGWAPYRYGRWIWLDYYGWTWYSYDPWGWAPYHYGRWFHDAHFGWGWYPGPYYVHNYWRPALVTFFGFGSHRFSFGVGFGNFGWIPLAPGERFHPWYGGRFRHGRGGVHHNTILVDNSVNIYNSYRNARHANGVTVVDADRFSRGIVDNPRSLQTAELRRATALRGQIPVVPARESLGRIVRASNTPNASIGADGARRSGFFSTGRSRRTAERTPFVQQQQQMVRSVRTFSDANGRRLAGSTNGSAEEGVGGARTGARPVGGVGSTGGIRGETASGALPSARDREQLNSGISAGAVSRSPRGRGAAGEGNSQTAASASREAVSRRVFGQRGATSDPASGADSSGNSRVGTSDSSSGGVRATTRPSVGTPSGENAASPSSWRRFGGTRDLGAAARGSRARSSDSSSQGNGTSGSRLLGGRSVSRVETGTQPANVDAGGRSGVSSPRLSGAQSGRQADSRSATSWRRFTTGGSSPSRVTTSEPEAATSGVGSSTSRPSAAPRSIGRGSSGRTGQYAPRTESRTSGGDVSGGSSSRISGSRSESGGARRSGGFAPRSVSRAGTFGGITSGRSSGSTASAPRSTPRSRGGDFSTGRSVSVPRSSAGSRMPPVSRPSTGGRSIGSGPSRSGGSSISRGGSVSPGGSISRGSASRSSGGGVRSSAGRSRGGRR